METADLVELIGKYLEGDANREEKEKIDKWYLSFDENGGLLQQLKIGEISQMVRRQFGIISLCIA
jgi:hypothetical protein